MAHGLESRAARACGKFADPARTASGAPRAHVSFAGFKTLWVNTGTLCNIECANCYIESSPTNDRLSYVTPNDIAPYYDELAKLGAAEIEIGFTGGEPFLNPQITALVDQALNRGHSALILTNAMRPLLRPHVQRGLFRLQNDYGGKLSLRVSLDHYVRERHDEERGAGAWDSALKGLSWLMENGFTVSIAGRLRWGEDQARARAGYGRLFSDIGAPLDASSATDLILFPEMDARANVPEITAECWDVLGVDPGDMMCASSRMLIKRKGENHVSIAACTLLPHDRRFNLGATLAGARGQVSLNHPHCAKFCVLGGGACSG